ncbi:MAG: YeeE/YedE family protein [Candidatus Handelsmanbacteria bacterium]|nr:YeeE/YedE family protein [Candidatus Handelsmanbacteria bacterium]
MKNLYALLLGVFFGVVLVKSEVCSWFRIQRMFRFEEAHMYLVICAAVAVGALSVLLLRRLRPRTAQGEPIEIRKKVFTKGTVLGGLLFGMGWAVTGACPGPIYAQLGSGAYQAVATFAGAFAGAYLYAWLRPRLPH